MAAFGWASHLADMQVFKLFISTVDPRDLDTTPVDMSNILPEYHEFRNIFSKSCANTLLTHQPYDLKSNWKIEPYLPLVKFIPYPHMSSRQGVYWRTLLSTGIQTQ